MLTVRDPRRVGGLVLQVVVNRDPCRMLNNEVCDRTTALAPQIPRLVSAIVLVALSVGPGASAATDISTLATGANTAGSGPIHRLGVDGQQQRHCRCPCVRRTGGNQTITLSGSGAAALIFSNSSIPNWTTSSQYSSYDYVSNLNIVSSSGLVFTGKSNALVLQPGVLMAGVSGTFTLSNGNSDGSMIFAQGEGVLPSNATFLMIGGSGTNGYGYSKLVFNGGTTQTIGALNSSGNAANIPYLGMERQCRTTYRGRGFAGNQCEH